MFSCTHTEQLQTKTSCNHGPIQDESPHIIWKHINAHLQQITVTINEKRITTLAVDRCRVSASCMDICECVSGDCAGDSFSCFS